MIPVNARARFRVYFRTVDSDEILQAWESDQERPSNRILVVDSEISIREFSAEALTASGYQVDTADGGVAGWEALHMRSYDLLIIGYEIPRASGVAFVKKLRSAHMKLPVVLAARTIPTDALNRNPSLQLAATLSKPFTMAELLRTVKKALRVALEGVPSRTIYFPMMTEPSTAANLAETAEGNEVYRGCDRKRANTYGTRRPPRSSNLIYPRGLVSPTSPGVASAPLRPHRTTL